MNKSKIAVLMSSYNGEKYIEEQRKLEELNPKKKKNRKKNSIKRYASEYAISLDELGDSFSDDNTPEQSFDAKLLDEAINCFLRTLPADARNTFIGRYYFFDSLKDVARYCGMSEAKAKSLLYRTRQSLKAHLVKEGFDL